MSKNSSYSRYSTSFKLAVNLGIADQTDISSLPSSTRHNFRNADFTDIVGKEYEDLTQRLDQVKEILDSRTATAVAHSVARVAFFMKRLGKDAHRLKKLKAPHIREAFIDLVERTKKYIPEKQILKFFDMTPRRFSLWKANPVGCTRAPRFECVASYPTQLTNDEISKLIKAFRDQTKASWSAFAIAATLVRERIVVASIPNILSYARDLGLHKRKIKKKKQKRGSIEAEDVDEVWHMDVTQIKSKEGIVHYLHLLIDNYSRKILSWHMDTRLRAKNSRFVTKKAIRQMADSKKSAMLITDGGSEFDNIMMRTALAGTGLELKIAGKDVEFSNSMIEAVNKSLKYRHIFPRELPKENRLKEYIERYIEEYNDRPHTKLKGLTPNEVYAGYEFDEQMYRLLLADAREKRLAINRNSCPPCQPVPPVYPFNAPIVEIVVYKGEDTGKTCEAGTCSKVKSGGSCGPCSD
jgi:putative transposase